MKIIRTVDQMRSFAKGQREKGLKMGFVPTMGALHPGHIALVNRAVSECDLAVCSIFVNPIQFNNPDDLKKYPRTLDQDLSLLESTGCAAVFYPDEQDIYPEKPGESYDFGDLERVMEGKFRPGHFNGVAIVVKKLFEIVQPQFAYFGEKDYQQLAIIRELVRMENIPVTIVGCQTVRESDGLAMSSRNQRLSATERQQAPFIYQILKKAAELYAGHPPSAIRQQVADDFSGNPFMELEYFEISHPDNLQPLTDNNERNDAVACIAVYLGQVRLIDNIKLKRE